jgi:DNA-binding NtrC family response regulator
MKATLLIVDDDRVFCALLKRHFEEEYAVTAFSDSEEAADFLKQNSVDVILTDLNMPKVDGLGILQIVKSRRTGSDVIVMTAYARVESAVEAMKKGAYDYIVKPFSLDEISIKLKTLFEKRKLADENLQLRKFLDSKYRPEHIIGRSEAAERIRKFIARVSYTDATVLLTGESGTGKNLTARTIHFSGRRKEGKFISVHCAAVPPGFFETRLFGAPHAGAADGKTPFFKEAEGGTLVLNEIGDMELSLQAKLLGVLENRAADIVGPADVMIIATTNKELGRMQRDGRFRGDLFYRLSTFNLVIPPLRERKEDIPLLAEYFFSQYAAEFEKSSMQMDPAGMEALQNYDWPGNVRELKNLFAKLCLLEDSAVITPARIVENLPEPEEVVSLLAESGQSLGDIEKNLIREALKKAKGNTAAASKLLDISYETLRYRMKKFGIKKRPYRS